MSYDVSKCDQVVFECMQKISEIIVQSRVLQQHPQTGREINSKFSLHVEELEFVRNAMDAWKADLHMPLGIDIFWQEHRRGDATPVVELLERWEIMYEAQEAVESKSAQLRHLYKRAIILLRTLFSFVRMVPAYQVHKRIQKAYDSRDRSRVDTLDDMGFCLFPILDGGSGGSGLSFSGGTSQNSEHTDQTNSASTGCYSFTPLEAPHGIIRIKVTYRQGVDSKAYQQGRPVNTPSTSTAPNMTTSIIQDYVPDKYENDQLRSEEEDATAAMRTRAVQGETHYEFSPRLPTMPEDRATAARNPVCGQGHEGRTDGQGDGTMSGLGVALLQHNVETNASISGVIQARSSSNRRQLDDGAINVGEKDLESGPELLNWPTPEQGHGYADKRVHMLVGQGPAPFLTPGPHRHKLVPGGREGHDIDMEPLSLGPNADVYAREVQSPALPRLQSPRHTGSLAQEENDCCAVGRRQSGCLHLGDSSGGGARTESRSLDNHNGQEGKLRPLLREEEFHARPILRPDPMPDERMLMAEAVGELDGTGAVVRPMSRRNSISEAPVASAAPGLPEVLSLHGIRHTAGHHRCPSWRAPPGPTDSTPPFSYNDDVGTLRRPGIDVDGSPFNLSQPLVSFSPPFDAAPVDSRGHHTDGQNSGAVGDSSPLRAMQVHGASEVRCRGPRTSFIPLAVSGSPALLETLPESPFSWKGRPRGGAETSVVAEIATEAGRFSPLPPPVMQGRLDLGSADERSSATVVVDSSEGLPFAVLSDSDMRSEGVEVRARQPSLGGAESGTILTKDAPPTSLFALGSATSAKSVFLMQDSLPPEDGEDIPVFSPDHSDAHLASWDAAAYTRSASGMHQAEDAEEAVRSLEEELDGFRQFHQELGGMR